MTSAVVYLQLEHPGCWQADSTTVRSSVLFFVFLNCHSVVLFSSFYLFVCVRSQLLHEGSLFHHVGSSSLRLTDPPVVATET